MKLSEIEAVGRTKIFTGEFRLYKDMSELNEYIEEVDVYTAEQMQEYTKECVIAALKEYVGPYSDKKANSIISRVVK
ncbi:hypothetical protein FDI51_gp37 [Lactococcus virus P2]|uniref:Uncharacterized protein n=5 Tax=Skunavirus TaxID=1623305 RepID=O21905_BPLSK|nr:hypothetical protein [Bacillus thuringiensis]NP_044983.1 hypothetical protein sk1p39 [Lactococcus phage SK1]YP_009613517.1 hypothetical protein FDI51_gp37 [Lactococcus virus P2]YP_764297.1 hypothetical protein LPV712_gp037 [Lactococcus phage 712]YP_764350.1 hypothetical protein LPJV50_ORF36 [Lactococcus virus jj50]AHC30293.1 hypothetical protein sk1833_038 [Lactococcus phage SK1833]AAB70077.1 unknown [Lactococcus phage SK1]AAR14298.1 hypothetical protein [Lactococcus virus P2]ABB77604.1 